MIIRPAVTHDLTAVLRSTSLIKPGAVAGTSGPAHHRPGSPAGTSDVVRVGGLQM